jgi:hypothetical protein
LVGMSASLSTNRGDWFFSEYFETEHLEKNLEKKEQGASPALKIVSTLFPRKIGFDLG